MITNDSPDTYWAADGIDDLIDHVERDIIKWGSGESNSSIFFNLLSAYWRNTIAFYSSITNADSWVSSLGYRGDIGELVSVVIPWSKNLVDQFCSLITKQRLEFECVSDSTDSDPMQTARIGKAIANNLAEKFQFDIKRNILAERVSVQGSMFMSSTWRSDKGYIFSKYADGSLAYSGDVHIEMHDLHEVCYNWSIEEWENIPYVTLKRKMNRWDLVAQYPDMKDEILNFMSVSQEKATLGNFNFIADYLDHDLVYVREFYHRACPAVPHGRFVAYLNKNCVLMDSDDNEDGNVGNPYEDIPIVPFMFRKMHHTCLGVPWYSDLLPAQEIFDANVSAMATNYTSYGVQSTLVPKGSDLSVMDIAHGNKFLEYTPQNADGGGKPEPLMLCAMPPGMDKFNDFLINIGGKVSNINDTLQGNPPPNVTSGAMAATLSANGLEFLNSPQRVITVGFEKLIDFSIKNYQKFASLDQVVDIVGNSKVSYAKTFKSEDLKAIKKIRIREENPLMATTAGRLQMGDALMPLLQSGNDEAIGKYVSLIQGAPTEMLYQGQFDERMAVQQEIEAVLEGRPVAPFMFQNHPLYLGSYMQIISNPELLTRSDLIAQVSQIMQQRAMLETQFQQSQPQLYSLLRKVPMPQPMMPPGGPGGPQQAQGGQVSQSPQLPVAKPAQPAQMPQGG